MWMYKRTPDHSRLWQLVMGEREPTFWHQKSWPVSEVWLAVWHGLPGMVDLTLHTRWMSFSVPAIPSGQCRAWRMQAVLWNLRCSWLISSWLSDPNGWTGRIGGRDLQWCIICWRVWVQVPTGKDSLHHGFPWTGHGKSQVSFDLICIKHNEACLPSNFAGRELRTPECNWSWGSIEGCGMWDDRKASHEPCWHDTLARAEPEIDVTPVLQRLLESYGPSAMWANPEVSRQEARNRASRIAARDMDRWWALMWEI